jgi:hypothetical protein
MKKCLKLKLHEATKAKSNCVLQIYNTIFNGQRKEIFCSETLILLLKTCIKIRPNLFYNIIYLYAALIAIRTYKVYNYIKFNVKDIT